MISNQKTINLLFLITLFYLISCDNPPQNQSPHFKDKNGMTTRPDTELYFKNVRQLFYQKKQFSTHEDFYTFLRNSEKQPHKLIIWHHWQKSKVNLEITGNLEQKEILITENDNNQKNDNLEKYLTKISFDTKKENASFVIALQIYQAILTEKNIFILDKNKEKKDFFISQTDKDAWRITFKDFLVLVGKQKN